VSGEYRDDAEQRVHFPPDPDPDVTEAEWAANSAARHRDEPASAYDRIWAGPSPLSAVLKLPWLIVITPASAGDGTRTLELTREEATDLVTILYRELFNHPGTR
jgi:hypothetical protein